VLACGHVLYYPETLKTKKLAIMPAQCNVCQRYYLLNFCNGGCHQYFTAMHEESLAREYDKLHGMYEQKVSNVVYKTFQEK